MLQIHRLSDRLFLIHIDQDQLVDSSGIQKAVRHAHTDKATANQYDFSFLIHKETTSRYSNHSLLYHKKEDKKTAIISLSPVENCLNQSSGSMMSRLISFKVLQLLSNLA